METLLYLRTATERLLFYSEVNAGEGQPIPGFVLNSIKSQDGSSRSAAGYGAWYLKPKKWNDFYEGCRKKKSSDSTPSKNNKLLKKTPLNATAKAFDQFIKDNKVYTNSRTIKEILH